MILCSPKIYGIFHQGQVLQNKMGYSTKGKCRKIKWNIPPREVLQNKMEYSTKGKCSKTKRCGNGGNEQLHVQGLKGKYGQTFGPKTAVGTKKNK